MQLSSQAFEVEYSYAGPFDMAFDCYCALTLTFSYDPKLVACFRDQNSLN